MSEPVVLRGSISGDGDGDGYSYGSGYGYGYGYGYGSGAGTGYGYGDGDGYSYGYGYGYGSGYGSGDGDGYWQVVLCSVAPDHLARGATLAFWKSGRDGRPCNGGSSPPVSVGLVQEIAGPLRLCGSGALHATLDPTKWSGDRLWVVALWGEVATDGDKLGALKREIVAEIPWEAS